MRKLTSPCLLLLAGCASGASTVPEPQPQTQRVIRLAPGIASITIPDSAEWVKVPNARFRVASTACQTNDPMPNASRGPIGIAGQTPRVTPPVPGMMPNAPTLQSIPYIPNACPVTAGPLANQSVPAVLQRGEIRALGEP